MLLVVGVVSACRDRQPTGRRSQSPEPKPVVTSQPSDPPLARWLRRVPADARWAVVSADLGRLRGVLAEAASLLGHHSQIAPILRGWQARLKRQWGAWPLAPNAWARLGLPPGSGGALYRHANGATVLAFRSARLGKVLETINQAVRHRGERTLGPVKRIQIAGKPAFRAAFQMGQWTCATRGKVSWCANVNPARLESTIRPSKRNLWQKKLSPVDGRFLQERMGIWLGPPSDTPDTTDTPDTPHAGPGPGLIRSLYRGAQNLLGWAPRGLWLTMSLDRRLQLYGLALSASGSSRRVPSPLLPKPGHSGLAATVSAPLVMRLRIEPRLLVDHLQRLVPRLRPAVSLVRSRRVRGETLTDEMLSGEVVLLSDHAGVAAILGLRSRSRGLRAMKRLMLMLGPRIGDWQKNVRGRGRGWDLSHTRSSLGDVATHRLILRVPPNAGTGAPRLRDGRMTLLWGVAQRHLVVATDPNLFRRILARVDQPDTPFLQHLGGAVGRRGFADDHTVAAYLRPDDPLYSLPKVQRAAAHRWLSELAPSSRGAMHWIRALLDLTDEATLSCKDLAMGVGCHLGISLLTKPRPQNQNQSRAQNQNQPNSKKKPGPTITLDSGYREALIKKWGGNREGHLSRLRTLAQLPAASPLGAKASRILAHRRGVPNGGLEGLFVSVYLPWSRHRQVITAHREAPRELGRMARALQDLAQKARTLPPAARRRWYRSLGSTRITPIHSCCKGGVRRCESRPKDWIHPTWRRLGFRLSGSHLYRYQLILEPGSLRRRVVLRAMGDLNCNGRSSLLHRVGIIDAATGALQMGPLIRVRADD